MHVDKDTIAYFNVMVGNFQVVPPDMVARVKAAGKEVITIQFPKPSEQKLLEVVGDGKSFDAILGHAVNVAKSLSHPNKGVKTNLADSVFVSFHSEIESLVKLKSDSIRIELQRKKTEAETAKLNAERLCKQSETEKKVAESGLIEATKMSDKATEICSEVSSFLRELKEYYQLPDTASLKDLRSKLEEKKQSSTNFESLLDKLASEE